MRCTYRYQDTKSYWQERWESIPADRAGGNRDAYPIKYAEMAVTSEEGRILEAGCGSGRVLRFYKERGLEIVGMDYVRVSLAQLRQADPELALHLGDIRHLPYADCSFRYVLAFGLYHNFGHDDLAQALRETYRVLEAGGKVCASYRADNLHNLLIDRRAERRVASRTARTSPRHFHKMNLTRRELVGCFERAGFEVETMQAVQNMPLLYRFRLLRAASHKVFNESLGRAEGYRLSPLGNAIQRLLMGLLPDQFCNVFVLVARKPAA